MSVYAIESAPTSRVDLEAALDRRFRLFIAKLPQAVLEKSLKLSDREALAELARSAAEAARSIEIENQEAIAEMRARSFVRVRERCELLESKDLVRILGITKQALSKRIQAGQIAVYTNQSNGRKYYPAFQIRDNKVRPVIAELISEFGVDPTDQVAMNLFVQHLITKIDYSNPSEPENIVEMHTLMDDPAARRIIKREWDNKYLHGR
ncbi:hypothetical protein M5G27_31320 [Pseudomonas shahriarae]|jgi:hypothetical protein|uniref:DNA-binding protein n=1 Tax=Pseudomonas shahriarae TaxID=2745512 RepID=A0A9X4C839_9PSED|nr:MULTISPECIES: hypothetical protein [Pseudomonas]MDD1011934.1 hypothetical protein [Pseudomonas shahriarae]POA78591.1 hypothetical protein C1890_09650 [Pseudomonas sp. DP16D-R1]